MNILGISSYYHDSAACLVIDGEIIAAAQEERFTRIKHDSDFPINAIQYCLSQANLHAHEINYIAFYDKPFLKFERLLETYLAFAPRGFKSFSTSMPVWLKDKLFQKSKLIDSLRENLSMRVEWEERLIFSEHHVSHAASAFFPSPFEEAAILTMDGVGEWTTTSLAIGKWNKLNIQKEIHYPHSLGLLYSAFTHYTGFKVNSGEYKVMGLAPYGEAKYVDLIKSHLIDIKDDGTYRLDMNYFDYCTGLTMTNERFEELFGGKARSPGERLTQKEMDIAASIQAITEEVVIKLAKGIQKSSGQRNLCLAGGVALNCVANGSLLKEGIFEHIWIQPASGDAGGAVGAALGTYYMMLEQPRAISASDSMKGAFLGPNYEQADIESRLSKVGAIFTTVADDNELVSIVAKVLAEGKAVGWYQGRMEFGPRALGGRSILADPRSTTAQKELNLKIKFRESFRPFAPSILSEDVKDWFDIHIDSPYMLFVAKVSNGKKLKLDDAEDKLIGVDKLSIPRSVIPAVTHVDYSARIQTVHKGTNPRYYLLLSKFKEITGCPILVNTSFNVRGEPIVCTPEDAFACFMGTEIEYLVVGSCILKKSDQVRSPVANYKDHFELD